MKNIGKPDAGKLHVRLCVQRRLACSAGDRPAGVKVRSPVVWIAAWRETKMLKPIDKAIIRMVHKLSGRNASEREVASLVRNSGGRAINRVAKTALYRCILTEAAVNSSGVIATAR